jgi:Leucine-rich repeat (LRR) protein
VEFGDFRLIGEINLENNQLTALPKELAKIETLKILNIRNNPVHDIPQELKDKEKKGKLTIVR